MKELGFIIYSYLLLTSGSLFGQGIQEDTRYFYLLFSMSNPNTLAFVDTLTIQSSNADTVRFRVTGGCDKQRKIDFVKNGNKIYRVTLFDSLFLYDYSLQSGDTFTYILNCYTDRFLVDSVKFLRLDDFINHKHWFLHSIYDKNVKITWIENFGEEKLGWDWSNYYFTDGQALIKAICLKNQDLIYWNEGYHDFWPHPDPDKTCDFDYLLKLISIPETSSRQITLYPNPANDYIRFDTDTKVQFALFNAFGQELMSGQSDGYLSVSHLPKGLYYIRIQSDQEMYGTKFFKR